MYNVQTNFSNKNCTKRNIKCIYIIHYTVLSIHKTHHIYLYDIYIHTLYNEFFECTKILNKLNFYKLIFTIKFSHCAKTGAQKSWVMQKKPAVHCFFTHSHHFVDRNSGMIKKILGSLPLFFLYCTRLYSSNDPKKFVCTLKFSFVPYIYIYYIIYVYRIYVQFAAKRQKFFRFYLILVKFLSLYSIFCSNFSFVIVQTSPKFSFVL